MNRIFLITCGLLVSTAIFCSQKTSNEERKTNTVQPTIQTPVGGMILSASDYEQNIRDLQIAIRRKKESHMLAQGYKLRVLEQQLANEQAKNRQMDVV